MAYIHPYIHSNHVFSFRCSTPLLFKLERFWKKCIPPNSLSLREASWSSRHDSINLSLKKQKNKYKINKVKKSRLYTFFIVPIKLLPGIKKVTKDMIGGYKSLWYTKITMFYLIIYKIPQVLQQFFIVIVSVRFVINSLAFISIPNNKGLVKWTRSYPFLVVDYRF